MKRFLLVTTRYPFFARYGARGRLESIARWSAPRGTVDLLCFAPTSGGARDLDAEKGLFRETHLLPRRGWRGAGAALRAFLSGRSAQEALYADPGMAAWIESRGGEYDVAIFHLIRAGQYLPRCGSAKKILELTDALSLAHARRAERARGPLRLLHRMEARRCLASEGRQAALCDRAVLVSEIDRDHLAAAFPNLRDRLEVLPLGLPDGLFSSGYRPEGPSLLFVGALWFPPNIEACDWFSRRVVPELARRVPGFRFEIVGAGPEHVLRRFGRVPGTRVHGFVPDLAGLASKCRAAVAPMLSGSGMQSKVVESLALGLPTLCSPLAAAPIQDWAGDVLRICSEPGEYVERFAELCASDSLCADLSAKGRARARAALHESVVGERFRSLL